MKDFLLSQPPVANWWSHMLLALRVLVAAFFVMMAIKNLSGDDQMVADFQRWGYSDGFRRVTASLQIVGAVALIVPGTCFLGAGLLACILVGAAVTHLRFDPAATALSPGIFLVLITVFLVTYRPLAFR